MNRSNASRTIVRARKSQSNKILLSAAAAASLAIVGEVKAQLSITNGGSISENFDALGTSSTASLPSNWLFSAQSGGTASLWSAGVANVTQQASGGTPTTGGRWNWGNGTTTTDRSPGFMTSGSYSSPNSIMAFLQNNTSGNLSSFTLSYDIERYRINTSAASVTFFTSTDGTNWTARSQANAPAINTGANNYFFTSPGLFQVSNAVVNNLAIPAGGSLYLRWNFTNTGNTNSQGLGLDNVSLNNFVVSSPRNLIWDSDSGTGGIQEGAGTWNQSNTNWQNAGTNVSFSNSNADNITFGDNSGTLTSGTVDLGEAISAGTLTFAKDGYTITDSGNAGLNLAGPVIVNTGVTGTMSAMLVGSGGIIKTGSGTLALTGANSTFTGAIAINGGTVSAASNAALGDPTNTVTFNGGTLVTAGSLQTSARALAFNANGGTIDTSGNNSTFSGAITSSGGGGMTKAGNGDLAFTGAVGSNTLGLPTTISGGTLTLLGTGTGNLAAPAANTINGDIFIAAVKRVNFDSGNFSGSGTIKMKTDGAAISCSGNLLGATPTVSNNILLNSDAADPTVDPGIGGFTGRIGVASQTPVNVLTISGVISGSANVMFAADTAAVGSNGSGSGTLVLNAANTYAGATIVNSANVLNASDGVIRMGVSNALPNTTSLIFGTGAVNVGAVDLNGTTQTIQALSTGTTGNAVGIVNTGGAATLRIKGSQTTTFASNIGIPTNTANLTAPNNNISLELTATHTGSLTLSGNNNYTGSTTISGGTLIVSGSIASSNVTVAAAGNLQVPGALNASTTLIANGTVNFTNASQTLAAMSGGGTVDLTPTAVTVGTGTFTGFITGSGSITKTSTNRLFLYGASTYSNGTTVSAGTLSVNNTTGSGTGTGGVSVVGGILGGTGSMAGTVTLNGGTIAPGNSIGTISAGGLDAEAGTLSIEVGAGTADRINAPALTLNGGSVAVSDGGSMQAGTYTMIDYTGTVSGTGVSALGTPIGPVGFTYSLVDNTTNTSIDLTVTAIVVGNDKTWSGNFDTNWSTANNWNTPGEPNAVDATARFLGGDAGSVVLDNGAKTVGTIIFNNNGGTSYTISGTNTLHMDVSTGSASISVVGGSHTISAPIALDDNTGVNVATGCNLTASGAIGGTGSLTKLGSGTLSLTAANTYSGATSVSEGTLSLSGSLASTSVSVASGASLSVSGSLASATDLTANGSVSFSASQTINSLTGSGSIAKSANTLTLNSGNFSGSIFGVGGLVKVSTNILTLSGSNNYGNFSSGTTISAGTLVANDSNLGVPAAPVILAGGTLQPPAAMTSTRTLTIASTGGTLDATNGTIVFQGSGDTTWQGGNLTVTGGTLRFSRGGGTVSVTNGSSVTVNSGATLELAGTGALSDGTNNVDVINNSVTSLHVTGGNHGVGNVDGVGNTSVDSGASLTATHIRQNNLTVNGTASIRSTATGNAVSQEGGNNGATSVVAGTLSVPAGGTLDLTNNDLIIRNGNVAATTALLKAGYGSGAWNGTGITSSTANSHSADNTRALGVLAASDGNYTSFAGQTVNGTDVLVKYTYMGDSNLDGKVTFDDFQNFLSGFGTVGADSWFTGDFNYNGFTTFDDFNLFLGGYGLSNGANGGTISPADLATAAGEPLVLGGGGATPAPEPASLGLLAIAGTGLLARRRRK